jgi:hypothetical protein
MPEGKHADDVETFLSVEKSLGDLKQNLINYLLQQRKEMTAACDEKLTRLGYYANSNPKLGDTMPDGTVFAGISLDTGKKMYALPADAEVTMTFNEAAEYAKRLSQKKYLGHDDWRVPTKSELIGLFNSRVAIGAFNISGSYPAGWYRSASPYGDLSAWEQRFSDGAQQYNGNGNRSSVRLIR